MRSTDAPVAAEILRGLIALAKLQTMRGAYARLAPGEDGRIRTVLSVVGTETGRLSSSGTFLEPSTNLQNMSKLVAKLDPLYDTRRCFVPDDGMLLVEADLKQAEVFATAAYCGDDARLADLHAGKDAHKQTASLMFGVDYADVSTVERQIGKMSHALHYGQGWRGLMDYVNSRADITGLTMDAATAKRAHRNFHELYPKVKRWHAAVQRELRSNGYLRNAFGRRRDFFNRPGHESLKEAIAFLPQSTIADLLNHGLVQLYETAPRWMHLLLQIHDAVLVQVPRDKLRLAAWVLRCALERDIVVNGRDVRVPVEVSVGENWAAMEEMAA